MDAFTFTSWNDEIMSVYFRYVDENLIHVLYISIHALFGITKNYRQNILKFYTENAFNIR